MTNAELDKQLKAGKGPDLEAEYQENFARSVLASLRSAPRESTRAPQPWRPRLAWGLATVTCLLIAFAAGRWHGQKQAGQDVLANAKLIQETLAMFPNRVRAIVHDERGINLVLSDKDNVPVSPPIYLHVCAGRKCSSLVTFSGQEIQINGQKLTALADGKNGVIIEGNHFAWSSGARNYAPMDMKIVARLLPVGSM